MVLTKRLMNINRSPRRIDRKAGGRNKKTIIIKPNMNTQISELLYSRPCYFKKNRGRKKQKEN